MQKAAFIAHVEALATAVVGALVGASTTLVGQGVPDVHTQGTVAAVFGAFAWLVAIGHRWKTSPADAEKQVASDLGPLFRELLPVAVQFFSGLSPSSSTDRPTPLNGCPHCGNGQANSSSSSSAGKAAP